MRRLNFFVFFVCLVLRNDYVLYYICPMVGGSTRGCVLLLVDTMGLCFVLLHKLPATICSIETDERRLYKSNAADP
jgi:hypothetical protein